jgi:hypothetical protein
MDVDATRTVSRAYGQGVQIRFNREGLCWRKRRYQHGILKLDEGLVDLEHVLNVLGTDSFACDQARRLDPDGSERLARSLSSSVRRLAFEFSERRRPPSAC